MKYLLDTDTCIYWFKGVEEIKEETKRVGENNLVVSIITIGELKYERIQTLKIENWIKKR